ncbi:MAG: beta-ribofuranosylaminobenzene 5'-phosphate synthase, partial [Candidatus Methanoperedens sp.]|nr:beta-ribofuranosylaminobenzene 5'-phosphate synthase [Candidatus Methanoperedens sp.]
MLTITTPSRLHLALIDMNASIGRVDGSIGLTLDEPAIKIRARKSDIVEITGKSEHYECMRNSVKALLPDGEGIRISIEKDYPSHIGLGSGTQGSLAAGMAVNVLYDLGLPIHEVAVKVGRGGTSGIGVAAFKNG